MTVKEMGPAIGASLAGPFYAKRAAGTHTEQTAVVTAAAEVLTDETRE